MAERKSISKKIRFEIFKRDSFKCQYCGMSAPDVTLHVDHIKPVADGGTNHMTNLITSCFDCNMGKKDRLLDDNSVLEKQKRQLEELNERRLQLEMMMEWREGLMSLEQDKLNIALKKWSEVLNNQYSLNENGIKDMKKIIKKFGLNDVLDAIESAANQYLREMNGKFIQSTVEEAWKRVGKILAFNASAKEKPYLKDLYYMRGIIKNRLSYYDPNKTISLLERAYLNGASLEWLRELCIESPNWTYFRNSLEQFEEEEEEE